MKSKHWLYSLIQQTITTHNSTQYSNGEVHVPLPRQMAWADQKRGGGIQKGISTKGEEEGYTTDHDW